MKIILAIVVTLFAILIMLDFPASFAVFPNEARMFIAVLTDSPNGLMSSNKESFKSPTFI